ncbi:MAG: acyl-CoA/acyl-ACP dehydrogenase [Syntrophales bacterium]|jgi:alkylation response protein AidB-like acyl-CoA dehydrogenase|nr:acyl-CoA/acyl-ACP dehydrogenase [Syntrophales bacterium]MCU0582444.1 acyl-CoA/acyl-ACP dehydrogenase [Syntrophales bacterium]
MDFTYTDDQKMLKEAARRFLAGACPNVEWYLEMEKDEKGFTPELWKGMAELGWMGILFPEEYGGIGGGVLDMVTLMEEMGYAALPGPYFSTVILGGCTILAAGSEAQKQEFLPKIAEGALRMTLALSEPATTQFNPSLITVKAKAEGDGWVIDGTKLFVPDANVSDWVVVAARTAGKDTDRDGISLFLVETGAPGVGIALLKTVAGDKQCEVVFNNVKVPKGALLGEAGKGLAAVEKTLQIAAVAKCAEMLGGSNKVMELSVAYAKERVQFGKPIGSFQAVQHLCANMKMATEQSIYITYKAAWMIDQGMPEARKFAAVAKTWVSEAYKKVALIGHQIFGGTGYIVEHAMPIYSRRAKAGEYAFGSPNYQREIVAQELGL